MNVINKIKQSFCKHNMQKTTSYETKVFKAGKLVEIGTYEHYVCTKCGKEEGITVAKFIPHYKSRYNDL